MGRDERAERHSEEPRRRPRSVTRRPRPAAPGAADQQHDAAQRPGAGAFDDRVREHECAGGYRRRGDGAHAGERSAPRVDRAPRTPARQAIWQVRPPGLRHRAGAADDGLVTIFARTLPRRGARRPSMFLPATLTVLCLSVLALCASAGAVVTRRFGTKVGLQPRSTELFTGVGTGTRKHSPTRAAIPFCLPTKLTRSTGTRPTTITAIGRG